LEDKAQKDIASEEGVAIGVIKTRVSRAKKIFRKINLLTEGKI
jgi:DNA-directed RNA polymerase specialized sigma24 family protein